jgi:hypothetical protein
MDVSLLPVNQGSFQPQATTIEDSNPANLCKTPAIHGHFYCMPTNSRQIVIKVEVSQETWTQQTTMSNQKQMCKRMIQLCIADKKSYLLF